MDRNCNSADEDCPRSFACCPVCKNKNLFALDDVSLCRSCDWDSIALSVWAGDYDHVFGQEFTDQGNPAPRRPSLRNPQLSETKARAAS